MRMWRKLWAVGLGMALCGGAAWAQDTGSQREQRAGAEVGTAVQQDKLGFLHEVAFLDQSQISLGMLALEKSTDPGVRAFAQGLIQDHQRHLDEVQTYAEVSGLQLGLLNLPTTESMGVGGAGNVGTSAEEPSTSPVKYDDAYLKQVNGFSITRDELAALTGRDFDKAFLEQVGNFQKQGRKLANRGLGQFRGDASLALLLNRLVPVLQSHQTQAASLVKAFNDKGAAPTSR